MTGRRAYSYTQHIGLAPEADVGLIIAAVY